MNILFLGALYSQDKIDEYKNNSKSGLQFAAQNLQESLIEGLLYNNVSVTILSKPSLSTYPKGYCKLKIPECPFIFRSMNMGKSMGFINLPLFNNPSIKRYLKEIDIWYKSHRGEKEIWVYSLNRHFMEIALVAKKRYPDIHILQIVPDLPRFMGHNRYYQMLGLYRRDSGLIYNYIKKFDMFVLLCKNMADDLGIANKAYIVIEGIFSPVDNIREVERSKNKIILYTGNMDSRYGIPELLKAFSLIADHKYHLWLRGNGDTEKTVKEMMKSNSRIKLIPPMSKSALLELQKSVTVLVNPVSPSQEFSKYFFPSKTMDYLASGTPTLMFKLDCLPSDYEEHLYFFKDNSPIEMANTIIDICERGENELSAKGDKAKRFILNNKLAKNQVRKILDNVKENL